MTKPIALYDVIFSQPKKSRKIACVKAVPSRGIAGNYFPEIDLIMTPDLNAIEAALPHQYRPAWKRHNQMWFGDRAQYCYTNLYSIRGKFIGRVECKGYIYSGE